MNQSIVSNAPTDEILITCSKGLVPALEQELRELGYTPATSSVSTVTLHGTMADCMRMNLYLRTAQRVLLRIARHPCPDLKALYNLIYDIDWQQYIETDTYISIQGALFHPQVKHTVYGIQRIKDAVVDRYRADCGRRPSTGPATDDAVIYVHWRDDICSIYLDTSGTPLYKRGYRTHGHSAPLQETLAAGCLLLSGWTPEQPLLTPMCGSGSLAIEGALISTRTAPGLLRRRFGFMSLKSYDPASWQALTREAQEAVRPPIQLIHASDIAARAVTATIKNAEAAGMNDAIDVQQHPFQQTRVPDQPGLLLVNPEYGRRMGTADESMQQHRELGDFFKQQCPGWRCCILTGNLAAGKKVGLRTSQKHILFNGPVECRLLVYDMYDGTRKGQSPSGS